MACPVAFTGVTCVLPPTWRPRTTSGPCLRGESTHNTVSSLGGITVCPVSRLYLVEGGGLAASERRHSVAARTKAWAEFALAASHRGVRWLRSNHASRVDPSQQPELLRDTALTRVLVCSLRRPRVPLGTCSRCRTGSYTRASASRVRVRTPGTRCTTWSRRRSSCCCSTSASRTDR